MILGDLLIKRGYVFCTNKAMSGNPGKSVIQDLPLVDLPIWQDDSLLEIWIKMLKRTLVMGNAEGSDK
jgi:hypothetical protein